MGISPFRDVFAHVLSFYVRWDDDERVRPVCAVAMAAACVAYWLLLILMCGVLSL